jgi:1-acyl-sn-glycerol-3-phosphate acyltransferase
MQHTTIFRSQLLTRLLRWICTAILRADGWRIEAGLPPGLSKCVLIAAPHTSNWDFVYLLLASFALRLNIYWMGKASLFSGPFGPVMRWLGGIAVNREESGNLVAASVEALKNAEGPVQLVVPPEGTRSRVRRWKTGFYYIAVGAELPILPAYLDFGQRRLGLGPVFHPTGDIERDMPQIQAFYAPMQGKNPQQFDLGSAG